MAINPNSRYQRAIAKVIPATVAMAMAVIGEAICEPMFVQVFSVGVRWITHQWSTARVPTPSVSRSPTPSKQAASTGKPTSQTMPAVRYGRRPSDRVIEDMFRRRGGR